MGQDNVTHTIHETHQASSDFETEMQLIKNAQIFFTVDLIKNWTKMPILSMTKRYLHLIAYMGPQKLIGEIAGEEIVAEVKVWRRMKK